jgi:hypothetical protein
MASTGTLYVERAKGWLHAAQAALMAGELELEEPVVREAHIRVGLGLVGPSASSVESRVALAGVLAAAYLAEDSRARGDESADVVERVSQHLRDSMRRHPPVTESLQIARELRAIEDVQRTPWRELEACVRKQGDEQLAACGHLVRAVTPKDKQVLQAAWVAVCGRVALRFLGGFDGQRRKLAVAAVEPRGHDRKDRIAEAAGISRPTLNAWIEAAGPATP